MFAYIVARVFIKTSARITREQREKEKHALAVQQAIRARIDARKQESGDQPWTPLLRALAQEPNEPSSEG